MKRSAIRLRFLETAVLSAVIAAITACGHKTTVTYQYVTRPHTEEYGVTISSPDTQEMIVVAGVEVVRPKYTLMVHIKETRANTAAMDRPATLATWMATLGEDLQGLGKGLLAGAADLTRLVIPQARAYDFNFCASNASTCPALNRGTCKSEADDGGNFMFQVPAGLGDAISLSYVNPMLCGESSIFTGALVEEDIPFVEMHAFDLAAADNRVYIVGQDNASRPVLSVLDAAEQQVVTTYTIDNVGVPKEIELFEDPDGEGYVFLGGANGSKIGVRDDDPDVVDDATFYKFYQPDGAALANTKVASANQFYEDDSPVCSGLAPVDGSYNRLFLYNDDGVYYHEYTSSLTSAGSGAVSNANRTITTRELDLNVSDSGGTSYAIENLPFARLVEDPVGIEDLLVFVAEVSGPGLSPSFFMFQVDVTTLDLCDTVTAYLEDGYAFGPDATGVSVTMLDETEGIGVYGALAPMMAVLKKDEQKAFIVELYDVENTISYALDPDRQLASSGDATYALSIKRTVAEAVALHRPRDGIEELFLVGEKLGGSDFLVNYTNITSDYEKLSPQYAIVPEGFFFDDDMNPFLILDSALSGITTGKSYSFIRFYDLAPTDTIPADD